MRGESLARRPAVLMTTYALLAIAIGPVPELSRHQYLGAVIEAFLVLVLAANAAAGRRAIRMILLVIAVLGALAAIAEPPGPGGGRPWWLRLAVLCVFLVQAALLASTPMWERTRPGAGPGSLTAAPAWPFPRGRARLIGIAAVLGAGLALTLLSFDRWNLEPVPCPAALVARWAPAQVSCRQNQAGYPLAYNYEAFGDERLPGTAEPKLVRFPAGPRPGLFAADWLLFSLDAGALAYLAWLGNGREKAYWAARSADPASGWAPPRPPGPGPAGPLAGGERA